MVARPSAERALTALLVLSLALASIVAACQRPSSARFPHKAHLALECDAPGKPECLSCASCHAARQLDRAHQLPQASLCESCHRENARDVVRVLAVEVERPYGEIDFAHDSHLSMPAIGGQCVPCHAGVVESGRPALPPMSQCFGCHEHQAEWERRECAPCHERHDLARTLPQTFLRHDESFLKHHGSTATLEADLCATCHTQSDCQACHDVTQGLGVEARRPELIEAGFVHRGDFIVRHAIEARSEPVGCMSCHSVASCDNCHVERGVSGNRLGAANPHPPGWVGNDVDSRDFHGRAARRDLLSCAGCHEQGPATNCIRCHKVGGFGGNPHPGGFKSAQSRSAMMCRYCHETT